MTDANVTAVWPSFPPSTVIQLDFESFLRENTLWEVTSNRFQKPTLLNWFDTEVCCYGMNDDKWLRGGEGCVQYYICLPDGISNTQNILTLATFDSTVRFLSSIPPSALQCGLLTIVLFWLCFGIINSSLKLSRSHLYDSTSR